MLEIRYYTDTFKLTAWCRDETAFGNLDRGRPNEAVTIVDFDPDKPMNAYLYDPIADTLQIDPDYIEPSIKPTYSSHLGKIVSIAPGAVKPVKVVVHHGPEDLNIEYDCFVTEAIKDQFTQGDLNPGDYVIVHFFENDVLKPVCTAKIYPSWI